jgi:hypothetical protein
MRAPVEVEVEGSLEVKALVPVTFSVEDSVVQQHRKRESRGKGGKERERE